MKKYHIADLLTFLEVVLALAMTIKGLPPEAVFFMFAIGELCDAFDGICARRWHYPDDGKKRWWRKWAPELDQGSDIALLVAGVYCLSSRYDWITGVTLLMVTFFGTIEIITADANVFNGLIFRIFNAESYNPEDDYSGLSYAKCLRLFRRYIYLGCIAVVLFLMLNGTKWANGVKVAIIVIAIIAGVVLLFVKRDRLTQDKTPLKK